MKRRREAVVVPALVATLLLLILPGILASAGALDAPLKDVAPVGPPLLVGLEPQPAEGPGPKPQTKPAEPISPTDVPAGMAPVTGEQTAPLARYLERLLETDEFTSLGMGASLRTFYRELGFDAPGGDFGEFEENATLSFAYPIGDADGDGTDDVALNVYCTDPDACGGLGAGSGVPTATQGEDLCQPYYRTEPNPRPGVPFAIPNRLFAVSGADGSVLWARDQSRMGWNLTDPVSYVQHYFAMLCPFDFVVGSIPLPDGRQDLLVSRFAMYPRPPSLDEASFPTPYSCPIQEVPVPGVGPVPTAFVSNPECRYALIQHDTYAVSHEDGSVRWHHPVNGSLVILGDSAQLPILEYMTRTVHADNWFVNPILQVPDRNGVDLVPAETGAALFLQGVSFDLRYVAAGQLPGYTAAPRYLDDYQPREWATRLDLATGAEAWNNPTTFGPGGPLASPGPRSVLPIALPMVLPAAMAPMSRWPDPHRHPTLQGAFPLPIDPPFGDRHHWRHVPCCFDVTGDHEPDLVYATLEWSPNTWDDETGATVSSRLVVFDGATGQLAWSEVTEPGTARFLHAETGTGHAWFAPYVWTAFVPYFERVGDADGDGDADILLHLRYFHEEYRHVVSVRDGSDGHELWRLERPRHVLALPFGDADGDGGNDLALVEWSDWEFPYETKYHDANVTVIPIETRSGRDGHVLWSNETRAFSAPIDVRFQYEAFKVGGLPDVNGDGVGDLLVDDPLYLPDLEVVHRNRYLDGRDGSLLYEVDSVGSFALVAYAGDLTGDGVDDFSLLNGDIIDLWITSYDGHAGTPLWSRRLLATRLSDYAFVDPSLRYIPLTLRDEARQSTVVNFQLRVVSYASFLATDSRVPQTAAYGIGGVVPWALPRLTALYEEGWVEGETTGTRAYHNLLAVASADRGAVASAIAAATEAAPYAGAAAAGLLAALPVKRLARRWRTKA